MYVAWEIPGIHEAMLLLGDSKLSADHRVNFSLVNSKIQGDHGATFGFGDSKVTQTDGAILVSERSRYRMILELVSVSELDPTGRTLRYLRRRGY